MKRYVVPVLVLLGLVALLFYLKADRERYEPVEKEVEIVIIEEGIIFPEVGAHGGGRTVPVVASASFAVKKGEILSLVGKSGCGKTTTGRLILPRLTPDSPPGEPPNPVNPPPGCTFHPRCPVTEVICRKEEPPLKEIENGHLSACHLIGKPS